MKGIKLVSCGSEKKEKVDPFETEKRKIAVEIYAKDWTDYEKGAAFAYASAYVDAVRTDLTPINIKDRPTWHDTKKLYVAMKKGLICSTMKTTGEDAKIKHTKEISALLARVYSVMDNNLEVLEKEHEGIALEPTKLDCERLSSWHFRHFR